MKILIRLFFILTLSGAFLMASIGKIAALRGEVTIERAKQEIVVSMGMEIEKNDLIHTKSKAKLQIVFNDNTIITMGKNADLAVNDYLYDERKPKAEFKMLSGVFRTVTGKIGKIAPNRFKIKTKTATIGIRGTTVEISTTDDGDAVGFSKGHGSVTSDATGETKDVGTGQMVTVTPNGKMGKVRTLDKKAFLNNDKKEKKKAKKEDAKKEKKSDKKTDKKEVKKQEKKEAKKAETKNVVKESNNKTSRKTITKDNGSPTSQNSKAGDNTQNSLVVNNASEKETKTSDIGAGIRNEPTSLEVANDAPVITETPKVEVPLDTVVSDVISQGVQENVASSISAATSSVSSVASSVSSVASSVSSVASSVSSVASSVSSAASSVSSAVSSVSSVASSVSSAASSVSSAVSSVSSAALVASSSSSSYSVPEITSGTVAKADNFLDIDFGYNVTDSSSALLSTNISSYYITGVNPVVIMPTQGEISYGGLIIGDSTTGGLVDDTISDFNIRYDFGSATPISGYMYLVTTTGEAWNVGFNNGTATSTTVLGQNSFGEIVTGSLNGITLYGSNAQSIGGKFSFTSTSSGIDGAFIGNGASSFEEVVPDFVPIDTQVVNFTYGDYLSLGYWNDGTQDFDTWVNGILTDVTEIETLIANNTRGVSTAYFLSPKVFGFSSTGTKLTNGAVNLDINFGSPTPLSGQISFDTTAAWVADIPAGGFVTPNGFGTNTFSDAQSSAVNGIGGFLNGSFFGTDAAVVGGEFGLTGMNAGVEESVKGVFAAGKGGLQ